MRERAAGEVMQGLSGVYVIRRKHGEGGFGVTYDATAQATGERVIVKELRFERLREWKSLELFEREGAVLAEISHPAIPSYRDFFALAGARPFPARELTSYAGEETLSVVLVQTFVDAPTLAARVESEGPLEAPELLRTLREMLGLLTYLHGLTPPVIHRDINPKNLLARRDGPVFLVDFGAIQDRLRAASQSSTTVGTLGYMPLEQLRGDARPASDLYALGVSLLVCATGQSPTDLPVDDQTGKIRVDLVAGRLPERLRRALDAMIEPIVGHRASSAGSVLAILDQAPPREGRKEARSRIGLLVAAAVLLAASGIAVLLLVRVGRRPAPKSPVVTSTPAEPPAIRVPPSPPPRPTARVAAAPPAGPMAPETPLSWKATVTSASGISLSPGAACAITTTAVPRAGKEASVEHTRVVCGGQVLYDQDAPLEGTSMWSAGIREAPVAEKASTFRAALAYSDMGARVGKAQASIDTSKKQALVLRDTVPVYRVMLSVEAFSAAREGLPLDARGAPLFDHVVEREATITAARGHAPARVGAKCILRISPAFATGETCRASLRCGTTLVYGVGETGYASCVVEDHEPTGFTDDDPTSKGGDPAAKVDLKANVATFSDDVPAGGYEMEMSLAVR